ncbi:S-layer homology domain-containing protein [Candidatus Gracilibacteria bacterium]|nr:S-layer homology domain-containing protein [Candidatus Gracilibacteria bacterium]
MYYKCRRTCISGFIYKSNIDGWTKVDDTHFKKVVSENEDGNILFVDPAGNTGNIEYSVKNIDKTAPTGTVTQSTYDPTNGSVTLTLETSEAVETPDGWTKVDDTHFTKVVSENGGNSVEIVDPAGNSATVPVSVENIDKSGPTGTITKSTQDPTNGDVVLTLETSEAVKTPKGWTEVEGSNGTKFTKTVFENGDEEVELVDLAGNSGDASTSVDNIDKGAPTGTITKSTDDPTNGDVVLTLETSEAVKTPDGWTEVEGSNGTKFTKTVPENGNYPVELVDSAGNTGTVEGVVDNINKSGPSITLNGEKEMTLRQGANFVDAGAECKDDVSCEIVVSGGVSTSRPGVYEINYYAIDEAGNKSETLTRTVTVNRSFTGPDETVFTPKNDTSVITPEEPSMPETPKNTEKKDEKPVKKEEQKKTDEKNIFLKNTEKPVEKVKVEVKNEKNTETKKPTETAKTDDATKEKNRKNKEKILEKLKKDTGENTAEVEKNIELNAAGEKPKNSQKSTEKMVKTRTINGETVSYKISTKTCPIMKNILDDEYRSEFESSFTDIARLTKNEIIDILRLEKTEVVKGREAGTFAPKSEITRAEFLAIVLQAHCYDVYQEATGLPFVDMTDLNDWKTRVVQVGYDNGIISGYADGTFRPNDTISNIEAFAILMKLQEIELVDREKQASLVDSYTDKQALWQEKVLGLGEYLGILYPKATNNKFHPDAKINRKNMVSQMIDIMKLYR